MPTYTIWIEIEEDCGDEYTTVSRRSIGPFNTEEEAEQALLELIGETC